MVDQTKVVCIIKIFSDFHTSSYNRSQFSDAVEATYCLCVRFVCAPLVSERIVYDRKFLRGGVISCVLYTVGTVVQY